MGLNLSALRAANVARLPQFENSRGEPAHSEPDGSDWSLSAWSNAVAGEVGEAANLIKKIERGDMTLDQARPKLARELADVLCYLDLLAMRAGVDLGAATIVKFNEVSVRTGSSVRLLDDEVLDLAPLERVSSLAFELDAYASRPAANAEAMAPMSVRSRRTAEELR